MPSQYTSPQESAARKNIDSILANLGWITDEHNPLCDVFTERPKTAAQAESLNGKQPDYVLYEPNTDHPIAVIEAKKPGKTLAQAIQDAVSKYAGPLRVNIVFASDGVLCETFDTRSKGPLFLDSEPITYILSPKLVLKFAIEGPSLVTPTQTQQTKQSLISAFSHANDLLRKEGLRAGVERFSEFSTLLFLKLISEIEDERESKGLNRSLLPQYCWDAFAKKPPGEMLDYINDTVLPRLVYSYNHGGEVFQRHLQIAHGSTLHSIVERLSVLSLLDAESDVKGDAFEYFLKNSVTVGNDLGEYFTPRHIVKLMVELIDPAYGETVYDPCCGTGGFLIEAFKHIAKKVKEIPETRQVLEHNTIYGRELTGTARIAKMNMILAGDGHTNIHQEDTLASPVESRYDVVLTNFPFSQDTDYGGLYGIDTEDANPIFLKHVLEACKNQGRIGVVVPEGLLFRETQQYINVRRFLMDNFTVHAVIALHEFVFRPYTGQPTAILILTKGQPSKQVWFYEVLNDGFENTSSKTGRPPNKNINNHLVDLRSIWEEKPETDRSFVISADRIRENLYKLSLSSYRKHAEQPNWIPLGGHDGVCNIMVGATPKTYISDYWNGEYPWATITDMKDRYINETEKRITQQAVDECSVKLLPKETVLISFKLSIGKVAFAGTDLYTNEAIAGLVPKDERILPEYLYHLIPALDLRSYMQPAAKGKTLNKRILERIRIPVPPLSEQQAFVDMMNDLEAKRIDLQGQANDLARETSDTAMTFLAKQ